MNDQVTNEVANLDRRWRNLNGASSLRTLPSENGVFEEHSLFRNKYTEFIIKSLRNVLKKDEELRDQLTGANSLWSLLPPSEQKKIAKPSNLPIFKRKNINVSDKLNTVRATKKYIESTLQFRDAEEAPKLKELAEMLREADGLWAKFTGDKEAYGLPPVVPSEFYANLDISLDDKLQTAVSLLTYLSRLHNDGGPPPSKLKTKGANSSPYDRTWCPQMYLLLGRDICGYSKRGGKRKTIRGHRRGQRRTHRK